MYALISLVIAQVTSLRDSLCSAQDSAHGGGGAPGPEWSEGGARPEALPRPSSPGEDEPLNVERDSAEEDGDAPDQNHNKSQSQGASQSSPAQPEAVGPGEGTSCSVAGGSVAATASGNPNVIS